MLSDTDKAGCKEILSLLADKDIFALAETTSKGAIKTKDRARAEEVILKFTKSPKELLGRKKVTKDLLMNYCLHASVPVSANEGKGDLVYDIIKFWARTEPFAPSHEKETGLTLQANTGLAICGRCYQPISITLGESSSSVMSAVRSTEASVQQLKQRVCKLEQKLDVNEWVDKEGLESGICKLERVPNVSEARLINKEHENDSRPLTTMKRKNNDSTPSSNEKKGEHSGHGDSQFQQVFTTFVENIDP